MTAAQDTVPNTVTRWWWVRHAPVVGVEGKIYGSDDVACDTSDRGSFEGLARVLPTEAVWLRSHLSRTRRTAQAIRDAGAPGGDPAIEEDLAEQSFGAWQGHSWDEMKAKDPETYAAFWEAPARNRPPEGESFADLIDRTAGVVERYLETHSGQDIVAVAHGGTIRAALSHALGLSPEAGMAFTVSTLSITCLEHISGGLLRGRGGAWRIVHVNAPPRLFDGA